MIERELPDLPKGWIVNRLSQITTRYTRGVRRKLWAVSLVKQDEVTGYWGEGGNRVWGDGDTPRESILKAVEMINAKTN